MTLCTMKNAVVSNSTLEANTHKQIIDRVVHNNDVRFPIDQENNTADNQENNTADKPILTKSSHGNQQDFAARIPVPNKLGQRKERRSISAPASRYLKKSVSDLVTPGSSSLDQTTITRSRSLSNGEEGRRRSIFGPAFKKYTSSEHVDSNKRRVPSAPVPKSRMSPVDVDLRVFSPPEDHRPSIRSDHFSPIDDFFSDASLPANESLPPLPTPLRRYCSDEYSGGVYPLVSPRPILRRSSYEPSRASENSVDRSNKVGTSVDGNDVSSMSSTPAKSPSRKAIPWAYTASPAFRPRSVLHIDMNEAVMNPENIPPLCPQDSDSSSERQAVRFDPRVTITEFEEPREREWFSDTELTAFKIEATILAQRYMQKHPQVAQEFREGRQDPITGIRKQRAMYTNPVFRTSDDGCSVDSDDVKELIATEVKRVLVVDPNKTILTLFCKSIQQMFPHAKLAAAQSGEDALKVIMAGVSRRHGFDIIVVEERLVRRQRTTSVGAQHHSLIDRPSSLFEQKRPSFSDMKSLQKQISATEKRSMSGSELLRKISLLQDGMSEASDSKASSKPASRTETSRLETSLPTALPLVPKPIESWRSLLIGVSIDLEHDGPKLSECGADILWGKPPPPMDSNLRNKLLSALLTKRHRSHLSVAAPTEIAS